MKNVIVVLFLVLVAIAAVGYWQGWFTVSRANEDKVTLTVDTEKVRQDKTALAKTARAKAKAMKDNLAHLWKKTEGLTGDDKAQTEKELRELETKRDRLEQQIKELEEAGTDKFDSFKQELTKALAELEKKIEEMTKKLKTENTK